MFLFRDHMIIYYKKYFLFMTSLNIAVVFKYL